MRIRYDHVTPWGTFFMVLHSPGTEPSGTTPVAHLEDMLLAISPDIPWSSLGSPGQIAAWMPSPYEFHEISLGCAGTSYTIGIDGLTVYGPVTSALRPTAVYLGDPALAYWYPTDWQWFSVDWFRVELPGPPLGACCFPACVCLQGTQEDCLMAGDHYVGAHVPCYPNPCGPTALLPSTWGRVKAGHRE